MTNTTAFKVWLITACSSGFGREMTLAALARGDKVIATARDPKKLSELAERGATTMALDVTSSDEVLKGVIAEAVNVYGRIDVLVNNAGYILQGAVEECSSKEIFDQFNTNVFGALAVLRAVLPYMRARRSGVIANMGSIGGWNGHVNAGLYCSSKFALAALSMSLKGELEHLGIEVTCIEPGYFRTNFLSSGHRNKAENEIQDYADATEPVAKGLDAYNKNQPGDPVKGAKVIVEALSGDYGKKLPARLALGSDAVKFIDGVIENSRTTLEEWAPLVRNTDCGDV
ncbi:3-oxoacyl-reductase [Pyronema omphalodes]|nr:3-oxoacyl-reductase [Pyronema omphalodes]